MLFFEMVLRYFCPQKSLFLWYSRPRQDLPMTDIIARLSSAESKSEGQPQLKEGLCVSIGLAWA
jgi:hypothetical protein